MVLRSCPRCRAIAEIVQPRRWSACASTSSSRVIIGGGGPFGLPVVRDQQPGRGLRRLGGATRVGKFSKQVWGESPERRQPYPPHDQPPLWAGEGVLKGAPGHRSVSCPFRGPRSAGGLILVAVAWVDMPDTRS